MFDVQLSDDKNEKNEVNKNGTKWLRLYRDGSWQSFKLSESEALLVARKIQESLNPVSFNAVRRFGRFLSSLGDRLEKL